MTDRSARRFRSLRRSAGVGAASIWRDKRWTLLALVAVASLALGFWGFSRYRTTTGSTGYSATSRLYQSLKLFNLGAPDLTGGVPWQLEVARFIAPLVVFTALVGALLAAWERGSARARARRMKGHVIVVGLGDKGLALAGRVHDDGGQVVAVERVESAPNVSVARHLGVPVLIGDATGHEVLVEAGIDRADHLISTVGRADAAAAIAEAVLDAQEQFDPAARGGLRSFIEISDADVVRELQTSIEPRRVRHRQEFFNIDDRAAQAIVGGFDDLWNAAERHSAPSPVLVVGSGPIAEGVVVELARRWDVVRHDCVSSLATTPLHVLLLHTEDGRRAEGIIARLRSRHPKIRATGEDEGDGVPSACAVSCIALDDACPQASVDRVLTTAGGALSGAVLTVPDESLQVRTALAVNAHESTRSIPVIVTATHRRSLVSVIRSSSSDGFGLTIFPILESVCTDEEITEGRLASMARSVHEGYRRHLRSESAAPATGNPADVEWRSLPAELRHQNIEAAQATWDALAGLGYRIVPLRSETADAFVFPPEHEELLAAAEHRRWFHTKFPAADPPEWTEVDVADRRKTLRQVREIPRMLAFAGLQIEPV